MVGGGSSNTQEILAIRILASFVPDLPNYFEIKPVAKIISLISVAMVVQLVNLLKLLKELHVRCQARQISRSLANVFASLAS